MTLMGCLGGVIHPGTTLTFCTYAQMRIRPKRFICAREYPTLYLCSVRFGVVEQLIVGGGYPIPLQSFVHNERLERIIKHLESGGSFTAYQGNVNQGLIDELKLLLNNFGSQEILEIGMGLFVTVQNKGNSDVDFQYHIEGNLVTRDNDYPDTEHY